MQSIKSSSDRSDSASASYSSYSKKLKKENGGGKKWIYQGGCDDIQDGMNFDLIICLSLALFPAEGNFDLIASDVTA